MVDVLPFGRCSARWWVFGQLGDFLTCGRLAAKSRVSAIWESFCHLWAFWQLVDFLPLVGFLPLERFSARQSICHLAEFLKVGRLSDSWQVFWLKEINQEKGYKYARFGRCHSFSNSSNLTCNGYTVTGEGLVELTS